MDICVQTPHKLPITKRVDCNQLAKSSRYFASLFEGKVGSPDETQKTIQINDAVEADMFWVMVDACEAKSPNTHLVNSLSLTQLFALAVVCDRFLCESVFGFVMARLEALLVWRRCREYEFVESPTLFRDGPGAELVAIAQERMISNFQVNHGFGCMGFSSVCVVLENKQVPVNDNALYQCLVDWWNGPCSPSNSPSERKECARKLIELIRFDKMSGKFLADVVGEDRSITSVDPELVALWAGRVAHASYSILRGSTDTTENKLVNSRLVHGRTIDLQVDLKSRPIPKRQVSLPVWISGHCFIAFCQIRGSRLVIGTELLHSKRSLASRTSLSLILPTGEEFVLSQFSHDILISSRVATWSCPNALNVDVEVLCENKKLSLDGVLHFRIHMDDVCDLNFMTSSPMDSHRDGEDED